MTYTATLADRLAATAAGAWGEEAAVWLLTTHGHWLPELDRVGLVYEDQNSASASLTHMRIRWDLDGSEAGGMVGTRSEWQVLYVACGLATHQDVALNNLPSLDETNRRLVLHAVAWAAGGREWAESLRLLPAAEPEAHPGLVQCNACWALGDIFTGDDGRLYLNPSGQIGHVWQAPAQT